MGKSAHTPAYEQIEFLERKLQEKEDKIEHLNEYTDKLADLLPVGMLPKDIENLRSANAEMADEIERLKEKCDKQVEILRSAFPEKSGSYFICGSGGEKDANNLPETLLISPMYGAGWFASYKKTDHYGGKG